MINRALILETWEDLKNKVNNLRYQATETDKRYNKLTLEQMENTDDYIICHRCCKKVTVEEYCTCTKEIVD